MDFISSAIHWTITNNRRLRYTVIMRTNVKFALLWTVFVIGSFLHDFFAIPRSYFSEKGNFFNVVFVKNGWGWTLLFLFLYISLNLMKQNIKKPLIYFKHNGRLIVYTLTWYAFVTIFLRVESWSGSCLGESNIDDMSACKKNGYLWNGFDISGHCFLLTFCVLNINKEIYETMNLQIAQDIDTYENGQNGSAYENLMKKYDFRISDIVIPGIVVDRIYNIIIFCMIFLMILWEVMLFFTCLYFHTLLQKLLGMSFGLLGYYICHQIFTYEYNFLPVKVGLVNSNKED